MHNEKKFVCQHCGKSFGWKGAMHFHEKSVHLKITEFKCEECDKSFSTKGNLRKHVSVCHSEERPFSCDKVKWYFKPWFFKSVLRKGQINSEWIYEVIVSPKMPTKN